MPIANIPVEIFNSYVVEKLRKTNPHLAYAFDESHDVLGGAVVHIPQAGSSPDVVKNRSTFPATVLRRSDGDITYALDVFSTNPMNVTWQEQNELSYNKMDSIIGDHMSTLAENIGDNAFYYWCKGKKYSDGSYVDAVLPAANILSTTGDATAVNAVDGQTGTRKALTAKDLSNAQSVMDKAKVPAIDRYACLEAYMYQQLLDSLSSNQMAAFQAAADLKSGVVGELYGFKIMKRSSVLAFTSDGTLKAPEVVLDETDNLASFCWQKNSVAKALGETKIFRRDDDPIYYGDISSAGVKFGGRCRRSSWAGVIAIAQGATA